MGARRKRVKRYKPLLPNGALRRYLRRHDHPRGASGSASQGRPLILVDTSAWIHFLRPDGDPGIAREVATVLAGGGAFWCQTIQLELWNGARGNHEKKVLREFGRALGELSIDDEVWKQAYDLARSARARGITVPATDAVIAACALRYGARVLAADKDFDLLRTFTGQLQRH